MSVKSNLCGALLGVIVSMYSFSSYAQETIHVGTEPTFAPFGFVDDKTSEIVGFDIDVINAIDTIHAILSISSILLIRLRQHYSRVNYRRSLCSGSWAAILCCCLR